MKKLMFASAVAVTALFVRGGDTAYVVPEGTAENTPASPYDTWATAANDIRTAADQTAANGVVNVKSGTYTGSWFVPNHAIELRAVDAVDPTQPGVVSFGSSVFGFGTTNPTADQHKLTLSYGTFAGITAKDGFFTDGSHDGGANGNRADFQFIVSGEGTYLDMNSCNFYFGWNLSGTTVRYTDHAGGTHKNTYIGLCGNCSYSTLQVDGYSSVTSGQWIVGREANNCRIVISNGFFTVKGYDAGYLGNATVPARNARVVLAGEGSQFKIGTTYIYGGSGFLFNMSEFPIAAIAGNKSPVYGSTLNFSEGSVVEFDTRGLEEYKRRLRRAGVLSLSQPLVCQYSGNPLVLPEGFLDSVNDSAGQVSGFSVRQSVSYLYLDYTGTAEAETTYVVPEDTEGADPLLPYNSWADASTNIAVAAAKTSVGGTVKILAGSYLGSGYGPAKRATFTVVSAKDDDTPGTVTLGDTFYTSASATESADVNSCTLSSGTYRFNIKPSPNANVFTDYGSWNTVANIKINVTGVNTVLSASTAAFYCGFAMRGTTMTLDAGATMNVATMYVGLCANSKDSKFIVKNGATLNATQFRVGEMSEGSKVEVDNGTVNTVNFSLGKAGVENGEQLTLKGMNPVINASANVFFYDDSKVVFDVTSAPIGGYATVPLKGKDVRFMESSEISLAGVAELAQRKRYDAPGERCVLTLVEGTTALSIPASALETARASLPEDCKLYVDGNSLKLKVGATGLMFIVQ